MLIISGHITVDPQHRDAAVEAMQPLVERARETAGCLDLAISADSVDPARINNYERWQSQAALDQWREIADPPSMGTDIVEDHVTLYDIAGEREPF